MNNTKELNRMLRDRARMLGLCDQWYDGWEKKETKQQLIEKYLRGIDFCIKHDYPNLDFIKANFPKDLLIVNGIFVDENVDASNLKTAVLLGQSKGGIIYNWQRCGNIYLRHNSDLTIEVTDGARVFIEIYEDSHLKVSADNYSKAFVYQHGGTVEAEGNVTVRDKRKAE